MLHQKLFPDEKGYFRKIAVYIGGRSGLRWEKIPEAVNEWIEKMNLCFTCLCGKHCELNEKRCVELHVEYEKIHPFVDGNGRTGRMFMNWWRIRNNLPILVIKEKERFDYYKWFK